MKVSLIEILQEIPDFRERSGKRHPLWFVLLLIIMGTMSGYYGYRPLGDFVESHREALIELLSIPKKRVPSYSTIRRVMLDLNYQDLIDAFNQWAKQYTVIESEWLAIDGKSIKGTVTNATNSQQNFIYLVSAFSRKQGIVVNSQQFESKSGSEIKTVQELIKGLDLQGETFTLDALHCQKKTTEIIINSGNDYVIAVKKNQPELFTQVVDKVEKSQAVSSVTEVEITRGRTTSRTVEVYQNTLLLKEGWKGVKTLIKVTRSGTRAERNYEPIVYYISSKTAEAQVFAEGIRGHWQIENQLHWVKDVVLKEDSSPISQKNAALNFSIIRTLILNILRSIGYVSIAQAQRLLASDLFGIWELLKE